MPSVNVNQGGNLKPSIPFEAAEQRSMWRGRPRPLPPSDLPVFASELLVLLLPCSRRTVILTTRGGLSCCENHRVSERRQNLSFQWKACFLCSSLREKKNKKTHGEIGAEVLKLIKHINGMFSLKMFRRSSQAPRPPGCCLMKQESKRKKNTLYTVRPLFNYSKSTSILRTNSSIYSRYQKHKALQAHSDYKSHK